MLFVSWLACSLSPSTVTVYLAAVRSLHIDFGFPDPTHEAHRLRRVLRGIQRCGGSSRLPRLPVTSEIMRAIFRSLSLTPLSHDSLMFWSACCVAYFGFLRVSEFTTSPPFNAFVHLSVADVTRLPVTFEARFRVLIKTSKTDPFGRGCFIYLAPTRQCVCPVTALQSYLEVRGLAPGPLFLYGPMAVR